MHIHFLHTIIIYTQLHKFMNRHIYIYIHIHVYINMNICIYIHAYSLFCRGIFSTRSTSNGRRQSIMPFVCPIIDHHCISIRTKFICKYKKARCQVAVHFSIRIYVIFSGRIEYLQKSMLQDWWIRTGCSTKVNQILPKYEHWFYIYIYIYNIYIYIYIYI